MGKKEREEEVFVLGGKRQYYRVNYSGIFDYKQLLNAVRSFFNEKHYAMIQEEHTESAKSSGRETKFDIAPFRDVDEYVRFKINLELLMWRSLDVVVEENGKKIRKQKGDLEVRFKASIVKNYKPSFQKNKFGGFLRQTYERYIIRRRLLDYEEKLQAETEELINRIKSVLGISKR